jgi:hypothetical protein
MTRAIPVVIERSPSGGNGIHMQVGQVTKFRIPCSDFHALCWTREQLVAQGAEKAERGRVLRLIGKELLRKARAEVTAEVSVAS